jgi:hypothetical protein
MARNHRFEDSDCKMYWNNGNLNYEGGILDSKKHGNGKEYWKNGNLYFDGYFSGGLVDDPNCTLFHNNGKVSFIGMYKNGKKHGKGILYDKDGKKVLNGFWYDGEFSETERKFEQPEVTAQSFMARAIKIHTDYVAQSPKVDKVRFFAWDFAKIFKTDQSLVVDVVKKNDLSLL